MTDARAIIGAFIAMVGCDAPSTADDASTIQMKGADELSRCHMLRRGSACGCLKTADQIIAALASAGLVVVPKEPTDEMLRRTDGDGALRTRWQNTWRAMLTAAPTDGRQTP